MEDNDTNSHKDIYKYRMFLNEFPSVGDIVMAKVTSVSDSGAECELLEYACIEAYLSPGEVSKKKSKNIKKVLRVGKLEPLQVITVDKERNYIDLSKRYLNQSDIDDCNDRFQKSKFVQSLFCRISETQHHPLLKLLSDFTWPLNECEDYRDAYEALEICTKKQILLGQLPLFTDKSVNFTTSEFDTIQYELKKALDHRLKPKEQSIEALIQVNCFSRHGIDAIKAALLAGKKCGTTDHPLVVVTSADGPKNVGTYAIRTKTYDEEEAIQVINRAIKEVKKVILEYPGSKFDIYKKPRSI